MDRNTRRADARETEGASLAQRVVSALAATGRLRLPELDVSASDGEVTLRGRVPSYYQKQVAQTAALHVPGVRGVHNELDVAGTTA
jgi:osmotically-inducible protein OsmY